MHKKILILILLLFTFSMADNAIGNKPLKANEKYNLGEGYYFQYKFNKSPKMGMSVLSVTISDQKKNKVTSYIVKGSYDMPAMKGSHASGPKNFVLNKKKEYLMPVDFAMPGQWEINVDIYKGKKPIYRGLINVKI